MKLSAKPLSLEVGDKNIVVVNRKDADFLGLHALERVRLKHGKRELVAIANITDRFVNKGEIATSNKINSFFKLKPSDKICISLEREPDSVLYIKEKIAGHALEYEKLKRIVKDVVDKKLSGIEIAAFLTALYIRGMSIDEKEDLAKAMANTGKRLNFGKDVVDKHSIGGVPGDKTSMVLVPVVAARGLTIPKTSSRAITSAAGTADRMEVLAPVKFTAEEIIKIVKKTNGCLVWGGALDLAPADDEFIEVEYPIGIDPLLLPSILSKKKSVGAKYVVIDIPTGIGAKISTVNEARKLSEEFMEVGKRLGISVVCGVTFGEQPIGYCIGPALEAKEALETVMGRGPHDLVEKVSNLAGMLFEMTGKGNYDVALKIIKSGKAEKKLREIIAEQGGDPKIKPSDIAIGNHSIDIVSENSGRVLWIKNMEIAATAKKAGSPKDKGAGVKLYKKMGDTVKKGEKLFTIYSEHSTKLEAAVNYARRVKPVVVGHKFEDKMLLERFPSKKRRRKDFMLER